MMALAGVHKPIASARSSSKKTKQKSKVVAEVHPTNLVVNNKLVVCNPLSHCAEPGKERIVDEVTTPPAGVTTVPIEGESVDESVGIIY